MIALDTNLLVYAHRQDSDWHHIAKKLVSDLSYRKSAWCIPWPCVHEFLGIVTHPKIYVPPTNLSKAFEQVESWLESPNISVIGETTLHLQNIKTLALEGKIKGPAIHDARIAAICLQHGVTELWTADRDFSRFPKLKTRNPLVG